MIRFIRIYRSVVLRSFSEDVIYRGNFVSNIVASLSWSFLSLASVLLVFSNFPSLNGWGSDQALVVVGFYIIEKDLVIAFFRGGLKRVANLILTGELDSLLLKPIDSQLYVSTVKVILAHLITPVFGLWLIHQSLARLNYVLTVWHLVYAVAALLLAVLFFYSLVIFFVSFNFYFLGIDNIFDLPWRFLDASRFPQDVYRGVGAPVFLTLFPLTLITTVPAKIVLGIPAQPLFISLVITTFIMFLVSRKLWQISLRRYTSAGG